MALGLVLERLVAMSLLVWVAVGLVRFVGVERPLVGAGELIVGVAGPLVGAGELPVGVAGPLVGAGEIPVGVAGLLEGAGELPVGVVGPLEVLEVGPSQLDVGKRT